MTEFSDISDAMEDILWKKGLLGSGSPQLLLNTMVYLLGLHFAALRGRDKHRRLRPNQLSVKTTSNGRRYLEYHED
jgi:hypothetical protein